MCVPHCWRTPPGCTPDAPAPIPARSKTATRAPRSASSRAIASPTTPAPTTATSREGVVGSTAQDIRPRERLDVDFGPLRMVAQTPHLAAHLKGVHFEDVLGVERRHRYALRPPRGGLLGLSHPRKHLNPHQA